MFEQCLNMFVKEDADGFCMSWYHPIFCHINPTQTKSGVVRLPSFRSFDGKVNDSFDLHKELSLLFQSAARESCGSYLSIVPGWCVEGAICVLFCFGNLVTLKSIYCHECHELHISTVSRSNCNDLQRFAKRMLLTLAEASLVTVSFGALILAIIIYLALQFLTKKGRTGRSLAGPSFSVSSLMKWCYYKVEKHPAQPCIVKHCGACQFEKNMNL